MQPPALIGSILPAGNVMFPYSPILATEFYFAFLDSTCSLLVVKGSPHLFMLHLLHVANPMDGRYHPPVVEDIDMQV